MKILLWIYCFVTWWFVLNLAEGMIELLGLSTLAVCVGLRLFGSHTRSPPTQLRRSRTSAPSSSSLTLPAARQVGRNRARWCRASGRWRSDLNISLDGLPKRPPATSLRFRNSGSPFHGPGPGRQPAVESAAPLSRHHPHDARGSGSGLGAAPWSEFALQRKPSVRQAALEHLATPTPFSTGYFRACVSGSRAADNNVH